MSDGTNYSRLERREYYDQMEKGGEGHVAKTPLHVARWLVQAYTDPGDWVLDPTIGAGTTAVEAITQGRNVAGMEVQFSNILEANVKKNLTNGVRAEIRIGDARRIGSLLSDVGKEFALVVNNPPYSGDEHMSTLAKDRGKHMSGTFKYQEGLPNLAFLKEGPEYWEAMAAIYGECVKHLRKGGILAYGIKDMMRMKKPFMLHQKFNEMITERLGLTHVGTAFLRHWPKTQFLNTYHKFYKVHPPYFQTIGVFEKE
jgi:tRNA G10  N-methylase Trm11